jgi:type II secretory pathway component GspD/PulD (secretin)
MTANEGGNSLVITDTQVNIRRMAEIVRALDTAISSTSAIRVYPLKYADAKALSTVVRELFQNQGASSQRGGAAQMQQFFRGMRGGPPGMPGGPGGSAATGGARVATPAVVATADERSNALVVSAPEEQMAVIEELVAKVDVDVEDVTELRVFRLKYADPQETADLLTSLFPDTTGNQTARGGQVQFGGRFGGMGGIRGGSASADSARLQKQTRVLAVPDLRTSSVVVSASSELIVQISSMIEALDSDPARKQKVFIYSVENTDPETVQQALQNLFPSQNYGNMRNTRSTTRQTGSQLNNRSSSTQNQNRSSRNTGSSLGGGSFGGQTGR